MAGIFDLIEHLDRERQRLGITKEGLARNAGYNRKHWSDIVNGSVNPSAAAIQAFAQALGFKLMLWRDGVKK